MFACFVLCLFFGSRSRARGQLWVQVFGLGLSLELRVGSRVRSGVWLRAGGWGCHSGMGLRVSSGSWVRSRIGAQSQLHGPWLMSRAISLEWGFQGQQSGVTTRVRGSESGVGVRAQGQGLGQTLGSRVLGSGMGLGLGIRFRTGSGALGFGLGQGLQSQVQSGVSRVWSEARALALGPGR